MDITDAYQRNDMLALEMGRRSAERLTAENLAAFSARVEKAIERTASPYLLAWKAACAAGPDAVRKILLDRGDRGQTLRSAISFRDFVPKEERDEIFREDARALSTQGDVERSRA